MSIFILRMGGIEKNADAAGGLGTFHTISEEACKGAFHSMRGSVEDKGQD